MDVELMQMLELIPGPPLPTSRGPAAPATTPSKTEAATPSKPETIPEKPEPEPGLDLMKSYVNESSLDIPEVIKKELNELVTYLRHNGFFTRDIHAPLLFPVVVAQFESILKCCAHFEHGRKLGGLVMSHRTIWEFFRALLLERRTTTQTRAALPPRYFVKTVEKIKKLIPVEAKVSDKQLETKLSKFVSYLTLTVTIDSHLFEKKEPAKKKTRTEKPPIDTPSAGAARVVHDITGDFTALMEQ
jgi:hypothetical protein